MSAPRPASRTGALVLVAAVLGGGAAVAIERATGSADPALPAAAAPATTPAATAETAAAAPGAGPPSLSAVYARRSDGVVEITATSGGGGGSGSDGLPGGGGTETAEGSGVVLDDAGHILTNDHVVAGATSVRVDLADGTSTAARVLGTDPSTDLAVIDVDLPAGRLDPIPLGSSATLKVGDWVMAIGNPFGYARSASVGIVSGLGRTIQAPNGFTIANAVQTDAAINHGNSGGALLDAEGRLIGIPAQIADSGVDANVSVGFAVPVDTAKRVIGTLERGEKVSHAWLGISTASVDGALAGQAGVGADHGALVTGVVAGGPAAKAGLEAGSRAAQVDGAAVCLGGDVITAVNDTAVNDADGLTAAVGAIRPGARVTLTVVHPDGSSDRVPVTLAARPPSAPDPTAAC